ncbi:MAG: M36 family metallopeptidase [Bacteroidota bacterium]
MTLSLHFLLNRINRSLFACIPYFLFTFWMTQSPLAIASGDHEGEIRYQAQKRAFDEPWQHHLRRTTHWSRFYAQHPSWHVVFNEGNSKPHRAYGNAIPTRGANLEARSWDFIASHLSAFGVPTQDLELMGIHQSAKYGHVLFRQRYRGLNIINSRLQLKFTPSGEVVMFGLDVFDLVNAPTDASISPQQAASAAGFGLERPSVAVVAPELSILAVQEARSYRFHLVYTVEIPAMNHDGTPEQWEALVDACSGIVLSRRNRVVQFSPPTAGGNFRLMGNVYPTHPYNPDSLVGLPHLLFTVGGQSYYTGNTGLYDGTPLSPLPATGTFPLRGRWCQVVHGNTGNNTPSFNLAITPQTDTIVFNGRGTAPATNNIRHLSAYYHTNIIHDYLKSLVPSFTALDIPLTTRVDITTGSCNAYFNGNSINFYTTQADCNALSMVADVVYHEYGHAITNYFYDAFGQNFQNGAMGEGYSDIFALSITNNPVLGIGFSNTDPNRFVRRYDVNPKKYPQNLVGQVHADGEIICGAWWRTAGNIGNRDTMMQILAEAMYGLPNAPNGMEGTLYTDILIDALQADDNDNNLSNGTPHFAQIVTAFAFHGITLLRNVTFNFNPFPDAQAGSPIPLNVQATVDPPFNALLDGISVVYRVNSRQPQYTDTLLLQAAGGNNYTGSLPAYPRGTVLDYYVALTDQIGGLGSAKPDYVDDPGRPNMPYNILIGFTRHQTYDFESATQDAFFTIGFSGDRATQGIWEIGVPVPSFTFSGTGSPVEVQPSSGSTPGGFRAAFTQNAASSNDPPTTASVLGGRTSLLTSSLDLSTWNDPVVSYMRWFSNDLGDNPGQDNWEVTLTGNGTQFFLVERTRRADASWRRGVVRLTDLLSSLGSVRMRFVAQDNLPASLVEAAIDDIFFYDPTPATGIGSESISTQAVLYPNPTHGLACIAGLPEGPVSGWIMDTRGRRIRFFEGNATADACALSLDCTGLPTAPYFVQLTDAMGANHPFRVLISGQ